MPDAQAAGKRPRLKPLDYHEAIRDYLKAEEPEVWRWYASHQVRDEQAETVRFDLLKSTYRLEPETQPNVYAAARAVAEKLGLDLPITLYQAQNPQGLNASLADLPNEAHVVLHGPVATKLAEAEFRALLGHELSHVLLRQCWDGEYLIVEHILAALTHDALACPPHFASARLWGLYNEVYCDRGSLLAVDDPLVVVSMLLKVCTELDTVSPASYLRQAEEIFANRRGSARAAELTHPEAFIRARAIKLWADAEAEADRKIQAMIEGPPVLAELDLLAQTRVAALTRRLIDVFLSRKWMQSERVLGHARLFFDDYAAPDRDAEDSSLAADLATDDQAMREYYCYVLLDFVTVDRDLEDLPLAAALVLCEKLGLKEAFAEIAQRELRLRKKQFEKIDEEKENVLAGTP